MVYKRYVVKKGKRYGPYLYKSIRDESGRVKNVYVGRGSEETEPAPQKKLDLPTPSPEKKIYLPEPMLEKLEHHPIIFKSTEPIAEPIEIEEKPAEQEPLKQEEPAYIPELMEEMPEEEPVKRSVYIVEKKPVYVPEPVEEKGERKEKKGLFSKLKGVFGKKKPNKMELLEAELKRLEKRLGKKRQA